MKKIYYSPTVKSVDLSTEGNLLSLSLGEGGPGVTEEGSVNSGEELTNRQQSIWDTWTD